MEFIKAVESGDLAKVRALLDTDDLDKQDEKGRSGLECAVVCGHTQLVDFLLKAGAMPDLENRLTGWTPLMHAANLDRDQEMKLLQHHGASINGKHGPEGLNSVHIVCRNGSARGFRTLVIKGANTQLADNAGRTPLHYAAAKRNVALISELLKFYADPSDRDKQGNVALDVNSELYKAAQRLLVPGVRGDGPREYFQVYCPERPDVSGVYQMSHDDHYQRAGTDFALARSPDGNLWCITDGSQYLVRAQDAAVNPTAVRAWTCRSPGSGAFIPCPGMHLHKPAVQNAGCDECKTNPILGPGYFCSVKHDYDLCGECEGRTVQLYPMVKYYADWQRPWQLTFRCHADENLQNVPTYNFDPHMTHTDVTCSACRVSPIVGPRYKCMVREGYDLCGACEASTATQGAQPHAMVKIYDPRHHPAMLEYASRRRESVHVQHCAQLPYMLARGAVLDAGNEDCDFDPVYVVVPNVPQEQSATQRAGPTTGTVSGSMQLGIITVGVESFVIQCATVPALNGTYALEGEHEYQAQGGSPNVLMRHPVEGLWCVSDGNRFLAMAVDAAAEPSAVREWRCFQGRGLSKCADMSVKRVL